MGVWLSQPGIDVTAVGPAANFIIRPDYKVEQIIQSGVVGIGAGGTSTVFLPIDIGVRPYIALHGSQASASVIQYPHDLGLVGATAQTEIFCSTRVYSDRMIFQNFNTSAAPYSLYVSYMVFSRGIA